MELEVRESVSLEDGMHEGEIVRVEYREEPYKYTDIYIKEKDTEFELKHGCPTNANILSKLQKLLARFVEIKPGLKVDPEKILVGKWVTFMTMTEESGDKKFTRIVDGSVRPKVPKVS